MEFEDFFRDTRLNMFLAWILAALIFLVFVESLVDLDWVWAAFSGSVLAIVVLPAVAYRDFRVMVPWEVLVLTAIPVAVRSIQYSVLTNQVAVFAGIAATALIIAVELHVFTPVKFDHGFAIGFTVITTLAVGGLYAVLRYVSDVYLGTTYLTTNDALMLQFIDIFTAGVVAGIGFDFYFENRGRAFRKMISRVTGR